MVPYVLVFSNSILYNYCNYPDIPVMKGDIYMPAILYGVGVGPGDPELLTLKAVRIIRENAVIACPCTNSTDNVEKSTAYQTALQAVSELTSKELVPVYLPMTKDKAKLKQYHLEGAALLESYLRQEKNVVFLTLGDPTIYSTFSYIQHIVAQDGYITQFVSGVPSFCAAAASLNISLAESKDPLHILPAVHIDNFAAAVRPEGNYVFLKSASYLPQIKSALSEYADLYMVENCGMAAEKIYTAPNAIPDNAGYFSLVIAKRQN